MEAESYKQRIIVAAVIIILPFAYFYPGVLGWLTLAPGDGWTANFGLKVLVGRMIAEGQMPFWNPYIFAGMPLLASVYTGALYPLNWIFAIASPAVAMNAVVIATYHMALLGSYLYARRIGCNRVGALVAGIAFAFSGFLVAHLGQTSHIAAVAWLPWIVLALEALSQTLSWRWVVLGAVFIALQVFAGVPQTSLYTAMLAAAYGLFCAISRVEQKFRFFVRSMSMAVCGVLLSCVQLIPLREMVSVSVRSGISYETFASFSLPPIQSLGLVFPFFFGGGLKLPYRVAYWGTSGTTEMCGYVGLLTLLLALVALSQPLRSRLSIFWGTVALISLLLAFGTFLPFGLHRLLYHVPIYNLFRVSSRNLLSVDFALATLAGMGISGIASLSRDRTLRLFRFGTAVLTAVIMVTLVIYRCFSNGLMPEAPPAGANSLRNAEALIPLALFVLSVIALWFYRRYPGALAALPLIAVLLLDLASFGHFYEWRTFNLRLGDCMADPPVVKWIKEREQDYNAFRILTYSTWPFGENYTSLNYPDLSIVRGLQSVNGYDMLQLNRFSAIAGDMASEGIVTYSGAFDPPDQSYNLLNVKYLLRELPVAAVEWRTKVYRGFKFSNTPLNAELEKGSRVEIPIGNIFADELLCITNLGDAVIIPDGAPVAQIRLYAADGRVIERELQAGRDTSEWAYDAPEVSAAIKHRRADVIESWDEQGFKGHFYLSRFSFERTPISRIEVEYSLPNARLLIARALLLDSAANFSVPLDSLSPSPERWRKRAEFGRVEIYENLKVLPRAWFVRRASIELSKEILQIIRTGKMKDGSTFDPAVTALFEKEDFGNREIALPQIGDVSNAEAKILRYEPNRIELQTRNSQPGFLVLSEIYYRGWEAWVDGQRMPVARVNYALRGLAVPAGEHKIEMKFLAHSVRNGAAYSALGVAWLASGAILIARRRKLRAREAHSFAPSSA